MQLRLHKLTLSLFRNHDATRLDFTGAGNAAQTVVIAGDNGVGKTNILEAISLLTPGKGLRGADPADLTQRTQAGAAEGWAVAGEVARPDGQQIRLGAGYDPRSERRRFRVDGKEARASTVFTEHFTALWLTPQMDGLFIEGASVRRKFLDRMVASFAPEHAAHLARHDKTQRQRLALLLEGRRDDRWLATLEQQMAAEAVAIAAARLDVVDRLHAHGDFFAAIEGLFPQPRLRVVGTTEEALLGRSALAVEESYAHALKAARAEDAARGRTTTGVHRSDMAVTHVAKNMPASEASTGEQKALLLSLVLGHAQMMRAEKGFAPVLLLDEVAAHLDAARRQQLFSCLGAVGAQVFVTGTDTAVFAGCVPDAQVWQLAPGAPARLLRAA